MGSATWRLTQPRYIARLRRPMDSDPPQPPQAIADFAEQAAEYVRRSLKLELEYDSETMPLLDHYLREASGGRPETLALVAAAAGAYFGEVVRRLVGGTWQLGSSEPEHWRLVLPGGLAGTREIMRFLFSRVSPNSYVNIMPQYRPCGRAYEIPELSNPLCDDDFNQALKAAADEGITRLDQAGHRFVIG